jgi:hypothetical protein
VNGKFCGICKAAPSGKFLRLSPPDSVVLESIAVTVKSWVCFSIVYEITYLIKRFFKYSIFRQFYASIRFGSVDHTLIMSTEQIAEMTKGHKDARHSYLMVQQVRKNAIAEIRSISSDIQSLERKIKEGTFLIFFPLIFETSNDCDSVYLREFIHF